MTKRSYRTIGIVAFVILATAIVVFLQYQTKVKDQKTMQQPLVAKENKERLGVKNPEVLYDPSEILASKEELRNTHKLLVDIDIYKDLQKEPAYTIFSPSNEAWIQYEKDNATELANPSFKTKLLQRHIIKARLSPNDIENGQFIVKDPKEFSLKMLTLSGEQIEIVKSSDKISINGASMLSGKEMLTSKGYIISIDKVL